MKKYLIFPLFMAVYSLSWQLQGFAEEVNKKVKYTSQNLGDPFNSPFEIEQPPVVEPKQKLDISHLHVQGIVWDSRMPQAIINNTVIKIGSVIGGAEVVDIRKKGVYILYDGQQYMLRPD